ncbi:50S ribosomal protein L11 methyltransferase [Sphaerisporangium corydalis]|uniref:50S ribosomal protein L11 methyltransferase n=1 Tax=Sphaerisporangium corydalis TaxID=1441875 RepID=A0ABV9E942_9ACTN|nr:50S ribosomal protein L11 methyltransferase [Sphaerisporangium corydalis]
MLSTSENGLNARLLLASMQTALDSARESMDTIRDMLATGGGSGEPDEAALAAAIRSVPRWHFAMLNDLERSDAYAVALERVLPPNAHVLDIGSGTGLLAMMVARAGAASVTTCEQNPMLAEVTRQIVAKHGLSDVITVVAKRSVDLVVGVDMPRRADLIVSEIVDCGLIGEGVLPTVEHAREHLLAPGGVLLPESGRVFGALLDSVAVDRLNRVQFAGGFDVGLLNGLATRGHFPVRLNTWPHRVLSPTAELCSFDFARGSAADGSAEVELHAAEDGVAHGMVVWFEMSLGGGIVLRNSPDNLASHWMQAFVPFVEPIELSAGDRVEMLFSWQNCRLSVSKINVSTTMKGMQ